MGRPRAYSDEDFFRAAYVAVMDLGGRASLAEIGRRAGVTPAALVKRFGTKRDFLIRLSEHWIAGLDDQLAAAEQGAEGVVARLEAVAVAGLVELDHGGRSANQLSALADDLQDDRLTELLAVGYAKTRDRLAEILGEEQTGRELPGAPDARIGADLLHSVVHGTALLWSIQPDGSLVDQVLVRLRLVLDGWQ